MVGCRYFPAARRDVHKNDQKGLSSLLIILCHPDDYSIYLILQVPAAHFYGDYVLCWEDIVYADTLILEINDLHTLPSTHSNKI